MVDRRRFLRSAGAAGAIGLAGCLGSIGGPGGGTETVLVGLLVPSSGGYGIYGDATRDGVELAFSLANASDDVLPGTELDVIVGDTKTNPEVGLSAARDLVLNRNVDHLMGAISTSVANAIRNYVTTLDLTFTITGAASPFLTNGPDCNRKTFRTHNHSGIFSEAGAAWSTEQFGPAVYLLYQDYSFGYTVQENVTKGVEDAGGEIVAQAAKPLGAEDYSGVIQEIKDVDPDWVSMNMPGSGGLPFYTQAASRGLEITCAGLPPLGPELGQLTDQQFERLPPIYSDASSYLKSFDLDANRSFLADYETEHGRQPTSIVESGFTPGRFFVEMLDRAGGGDASLDEVIAAGEGLTFDSPKGEITIRECDHQGAHPVWQVQLTSVANDDAVWEVVDNTDPDPFREPCDEIECRF